MFRKQSAILLSDEHPIHNSRWIKSLGSFFETVHLGDRSHFSDWNEDTWIFSTPLSGETLALPGRTRTAKHIGISNSLDLMLPESMRLLEKNVSALRALDSIWVDTDWAMGALDSIGVRALQKVPWGLDFASFDSGDNDARMPGRKQLLIPRLTSAHYQPEEILKAVEMSANISPFRNVVALGLSNHVDKFHPNTLQGIEISYLPTQSEFGLFQLIRESDCLLMAPKTDGTSITMLQSLYLGIPVISTPTIGAQEWAKKTPFVTLTPGFGALDIARTLSNWNSELLNLDCSEVRKLIEAEVDLGKNIDKALGIFN